MFWKNLRRLVALALVCALCTVGLAFAPESGAWAETDGMIRVLLTRVGTSRTSISMKTGCAYGVNSASGEKIPAGSTVKILLSGGSLYLSVDGETRNMGSTLTLCRLSRANAGVTFTSPSLSNAYCGDLLFSVSSGAILPVLRIYIEDYLYGVVAYEMSNSFPLEALKAQSVCARTYAMRLKKSTGSYDMTDNTTHQVFKGYNSAWTNVISAVDATRGQCLTYGGSYAGCWYTASNGGQTESTKNVWGGALGYSVVKDDPYDLENTSSVAKTHIVYKNAASLNAKLESLLKSALSEQLTALGLSGESADMKIEQIVSIEPHTPKYAAPSRTYTKLRFGLQVSCLNGSGAHETVGKTLYVDLATYDQLASALSLDIASTSSETVWVEEGAESFSITFRRYGHGVGMSQRGAQQMARAYGKTCAQILEFYFPGTTLETKNFANTTAQGSADEATGSAYNTLSYGDSGEDVKKLQTKLQELGYFAGDIGGNYLAKTTAAVKAFQTDYGFTADGIATPEVQKQLFSVVLSDTADAMPTPVPDTDNLPESGSVQVNVPKGSSLRVYSAPSTSAVVRGSLASGTVVYLHATSGYWAAISGGGLKGYINKAYLAPVDEAEATPTPAPTAAPTPTPEPQQEASAGDYAAVNIPRGSRLRVFRKPSTSAARVGALESGDIVRVYGTNSTWAAITGSGLKGYVKKSYLSATQAPQATPTPAPTTKPTPTPSPEPGESDSVLGEEEPWLVYAKVRIPTAGKLGLRTKPQANATCIAYLTNGTKLKAYTRIGEWARVTTGTLTGYVPVKYLQIYE